MTIFPYPLVYYEPKIATPSGEPPLINNKPDNKVRNILKLRRDHHLLGFNIRDCIPHISKKKIGDELQDIAWR